jgi:hypothetical protein
VQIQGREQTAQTEYIPREEIAEVCRNEGLLPQVARIPPGPLTRELPGKLRHIPGKLLTKPAGYWEQPVDKGDQAIQVLPGLIIQGWEEIHHR